MRTIYQTDENGALVEQFELTDEDLIPYRCVVVAPGPVPVGTVPVWVSEANPLSSADFGLPGTGSWEFVPDYRGLSLYSIDDASEYVGEYNGLGPLPEGYTSIPRPDINHVWKNGQWRIDLGRLKVQKHKEINSWRDSQENKTYVIDHDGHRWDYGKSPQSRLAPVVEVAKSGELPPGFFWTDADNNDVPLTVETLMELSAVMAQAMVQMGFKIHSRQRQMKEEIDALASVEEVESYRIDWAE